MKPIYIDDVDFQDTFTFEEKNVPYWQYINSGIHLLKKFLTYPESDIPNCLKEIIPSFFEYVSFLEGILHPFVGCFRNCISGRVDELFAYLSKRNLSSHNSLTLHEAFDFLFKIKPYSKKIFNIYNRLSEYSSSCALYALEKNDQNAFVKAFKEEDCGDLMRSLWLLRFVLNGIVNEEYTTKDFVDKHWCNNNLFVPFFKWTNSEEKFITENIKSFVCNHIFIKTDCSHNVYYTVTDDEADRYKHYEISLIDDIRKNINDVDFRYKVQDILNSSNDIVDECYKNSEAVLFYAIDSHKSLLKNFDETFFQALEKEWNERNYDFFEIDKSSFSKYILLYLIKVSFVYNIIENFLYKKDKTNLLQILMRSKDYEKIIIGENCIFNLYTQSTIVHGTTDIANNITPTILGQSKFIKLKCDSYDKNNSDDIYALTIHYLYLFLSGKEVPYLEKDGLEKRKNKNNIKNLEISYPTKLIECSESAFKYIMGVKVDLNDEKSDLIMNWIGNKKQNMIAFLLVYCGITEIINHSTKNIKQLCPKNKLKESCYRFKGELIYIKGGKRQATPFFAYWENIIEKCFSAAKIDFKRNIR